MVNRGEADSYYTNPQPQMQYPPQAANPDYQNGTEAKSEQPPPAYGQGLQNSPAPMTATGDGKQTFDQVFKLDKPKYNDLWAGILVCMALWDFLGTPLALIPALVDTYFPRLRSSFWHCSQRLQLQ